MYEAGEHGLIDRTKLFVELGSLVRYKVARASKSGKLIGIVLSTCRVAGGWIAVVQWNDNYKSREEWISGLELVCK